MSTVDKLAKLNRLIEETESVQRKCKEYFPKSYKTEHSYLYAEKMIEEFKQEVNDLLNKNLNKKESK